MAKKPALDLFSQTDRDQAEQDKIKARGVGMKESEWLEVDELARKLQVTPHAFAAYGLRKFIELYKAGKIKVEVKTTKTL